MPDTPSPYKRVLGFAAVLAIAFGGAALAGAAVDPDRDTASTTAEGGHAAMGADTTRPDAIRGLAVAEDDLRVVVDRSELRRGARETLRFRVVDAGGRTVRDFDVEHERRMHLILVRRDLRHFQHLHPEQAQDGSWSVEVTLPEAGSYRLFADFAHDGDAYTLAHDLRVDGAADLAPLPAPADTATAGDGYDVALERDGDTLRFAITRAGAPVETEPYLGAGGHLVALREGDLAFLHVHPEEDGVSFATHLPTAGRYRLFLQFKHEGRVRTAAFTVER